MQDGPDIRIGDAPAMPRVAINYLRRRFATSRCFLEYGAGGSTVLAARKGVAQVYSVESDPAYVAAVEAKVAALGSATRLNAFYLDIGPTRSYGKPKDRSGIDRWPAYSAKVWDHMAAAGDVPDTILVDGRFRVACCLKSFQKMADEALLIFDDYFDREDRYGVVTRFSPVVEQVGRVAIFRKPRDADPEEVARLYEDYACQPA